MARISRELIEAAALNSASYNKMKEAERGVLRSLKTLFPKDWVMEAIEPDEYGNWVIDVKTKDDVEMQIYIGQQSLADRDTKIRSWTDKVAATFKD